MGIRLIECQRVLKPTGSIYLHCDPTMSHYLKTTMDCIFGEENFRNEIVWCYRSTSQAKSHFPRKHDILLFYTKGEQAHVFNTDEIREPYKLAKMPRRVNDPTRNRGGSGKWAGASVSELQLTHQKGKIPPDWWEMTFGPNNPERTGYPTQKPTALLQRIIEASSNKGDIVLDPFAGCATTCVAAENTERRWIGIDVSEKAYELVQMRLNKEVARPDALEPWRNEVFFNTRIPKRTDLETDYRESKYVYIISNPKYDGQYKVGIAKNLDQRLNSYQTSDPDRAFSLKYSMKTPMFRETESHIHEKFPNQHEWVRGDLAEIQRAIETYAETA